MTRNKKGFTLVELVIVIAVIAILAGVMIAVFSGVVKRANESAELQKVKNEEIAQKADDILKKIDNANWFSWEDFENSLAAKLEKTYEKYAGTSSGVTAEQIEKTVKKALEEYGAQAGQTNTSLTEAQVKAIVENALAKASLGGVTENQVRTIVNTAVASVNTVSKAQVQAIVDAAVAKGLTATQVAQVVASAQLATATSVSDLDTKVGKIITDLATVSENALTKEDVEAMIKKLLPVTVTVKATETQTLQEAFNEAVTTLVSGSTIIVESETAPELTLTTDDVTTLTIKGVDVDKLTVNAPNATIYVLSDVGTVEVTAVAQNSLHLFGNVQMLKITKGRIVLEQGVKVENVEVNSTDLGEKVIIVIEKTAEVTDTLKVKAATGSVAVENKGTIKVVDGIDATDGGKAVVSNVEGGQVLNKDDKENVVIDDAASTITVSSVSELEAALVNTAYTKIVLANDLTINGKGNTNAAVEIARSLTFDGAGHKITADAGRTIWISESNITVTIKNLTTVNTNNNAGGNYPRGIQLNSNVKNVTLNIDNCDVTTKYYAINLCAGTTVYLNVKDSTFSAWAAFNVWSDGFKITIEDSTLVGNTISAGERFAVFCLEADTTDKTTLHSSNNDVTIKNSKIVATGANQSIIGFNSNATYPSIDNRVILDECTLSYEASNVAYNFGSNNEVQITNCALNDENVESYTCKWFANWGEVTFDTSAVVVDSENPKVATGTLSVTYKGETTSFNLADVDGEPWSNGTDYIFELTLDGYSCYVDLDISTEYTGGMKIYKGSNVEY